VATPDARGGAAISRSATRISGRRREQIRLQAGRNLHRDRVGVSDTGIGAMSRDRLQTSGLATKQTLPIQMGRRREDRSRARHCACVSLQQTTGAGRRRDPAQSHARISPAPASTNHSDRAGLPGRSEWRAPSARTATSPRYLAPVRYLHVARVLDHAASSALRRFDAAARIPPKNSSSSSRRSRFRTCALQLELLRELPNGVLALYRCRVVVARHIDTRVKPDRLITR